MLCITAWASSPQHSVSYTDEHHVMMHHMAPSRSCAIWRHHEVELHCGTSCCLVSLLAGGPRCCSLQTRYFTQRCYDMQYTAGMSVHSLSTYQSYRCQHIKVTQTAALATGCCIKSIRLPVEPLNGLLDKTASHRMLLVNRVSTEQQPQQHPTLSHTQHPLTSAGC